MVQHSPRRHLRRRYGWLGNVSIHKPVEQNSLGTDHKQVPLDHHQVRRHIAQLPLGVCCIHGSNGRSVATDDSSLEPHIDEETGILFCDYWLVKRKRYDVPALYDPKGIYLYKVKISISPQASKSRQTNSGNSTVSTGAPWSQCYSSSSPSFPA